MRSLHSVVAVLIGVCGLLGGSLASAHESDNAHVHVPLLDGREAVVTAASQPLEPTSSLTIGLLWVAALGGVVYVARLLSDKKATSRPRIPN